MKRVSKSTTVNRDHDSKPQGLQRLEWRMFVEPEVAQERLNICWACPNLNSIRVCKKCWCLMPIKTKLAVMACPEGRWKAEPNYVYKE